LSGRSEVEELFGREKSIEVDQLFYREMTVRESLTYLDILFWCLHVVPGVDSVERLLWSEAKEVGSLLVNKLLLLHLTRLFPAAA